MTNEEAASALAIAPVWDSTTREAIKVAIAALRAESEIRQPKPGPKPSSVLADLLQWMIDRWYSEVPLEKKVAIANLTALLKRAEEEVV